MNLQEKNKIILRTWKTTDHKFTFLFGIKKGLSDGDTFSSPSILVQVDHGNKPALAECTPNPFWIKDNSKLFLFQDQNEYQKVYGSLRLTETHTQEGESVQAIWADVYYGPKNKQRHFEGIIAEF